MNFGVIVFPGSNCDDDMIHVLGSVMKQNVVKIWHKDAVLPAHLDCIILPGGFSFGDYLRCGAIARLSPIMQAVIEFANQGGYVFGICNGFQILCEAGLLPGALLRNENQLFVCKNIYLKPKSHNSALTRSLKKDQVLKVPIAHAEGRYYADTKTLSQLVNNQQVLFTYCDEEGRSTAQSNPNGAMFNIAGICNEKRNVFGMMPHPERCSEAVLGNTDGKFIFESLIQHALVAH